MKEKLDHWIGTDINYLFLHPQKAIYIVFCYGFPLNICHISGTHIRILLFWKRLLVLQFRIGEMLIAFGTLI